MSTGKIQAEANGKVKGRLSTGKAKGNSAAATDPCCCNVGDCYAALSCITDEEPPLARKIVCGITPPYYFTVLDGDQQGCFYVPADAVQVSEPSNVGPIETVTDCVSCEENFMRCFYTYRIKYVCADQGFIELPYQAGDYFCSTNGSVSGLGIWQKEVDVDGNCTYTVTVGSSASCTENGDCDATVSYDSPDWSTISACICASDPNACGNLTCDTALCVHMSAAYTISWTGVTGCTDAPSVAFPEEGSVTVFSPTYQGTIAGYTVGLSAAIGISYPGYPCSESTGGCTNVSACVWTHTFTSTPTGCLNCTGGTFTVEVVNPGCCVFSTDGMGHVTACSDDSSVCGSCPP